MRLFSTVAALSLLAGNVRGQYRDGFGVMGELAPRSWPQNGGSLPLLAKRDGSCADGSHPCSDVNSTQCCGNTDYCIIAHDWTVACCPIGTNCSDVTSCDSGHYAFNLTTTTTLTTSASPTVQTATVVACSPRPCYSSNYLCPSSLGGQCCGFGSECALVSSTGGCIAPITSPPTTTTALLTIPSGCSVAGQTYCTEGGGCCDAGYGCTYVSAASAAMCSVTTASSSSSPTGLPTGATAVQKQAGLSNGAKAGITVGVIVLAALLIGAITYLCLRRRRRRRGTTTVTSAQEMSAVAAGAIVNDNDRNANRDAPTSDNGIRPYDAFSGPHMSEADGDSYGYAPSSTQPSRTGNNASDYFGFGPGATAADAIMLSQQRRPDHDEQPQPQPQPQDPDDVTAPVEIGSARGVSLRRYGPAQHARVGSFGSARSRTSEARLGALDAVSEHYPRQVSQGPAGPSSPADSIAGRFELYGNDGADGTPGSGREVFHDAWESVGESRVRRGGGGGGGAAVGERPVDGAAAVSDAAERDNKRAGRAESGEPGWGGGLSFSE